MNNDHPAQSSGIGDLPFVDLYVCLDSNEACYQAFDTSNQQMRLFDLPEAYQEDIIALVKMFKSVVQNGLYHNLYLGNIQLRATKIMDANGQSWAVFQPIAKKPRQLDTIGFSPAVTNLLRNLGHNHGLILVSGGVGQGKTTTSAALLYDYLHRYGGVACTLNSSEYHLSGRQGAAGLCYQFEVPRKQDWESVLENCLQLHARYLLVDELYTPKMVGEILRCATSGQLVIANIQAGSLEEGIEELHYMAEQSMGNHTSGLLAAALTAIIHQQTYPISFQANVLTIEHGSGGEACRTLIRERRTGQITTMVHQQMAKLK